MDNMDRIFFNGQIVTVDPQYPEASAVAVKNGIVMAVGTDDEMKALAGPATEMVDLKGAFMCPGLIDSHMHLLPLSNKLRRTDIGVAKTFLRREWDRAMTAEVTPNCREACSGCGAASYGCGICFVPRGKKAETGEPVPSASGTEGGKA